jgi:hypothetical protein
MAVQLVDFRHSINNHLTRIMAAADLIRCKPELATRFADTLCDAPRKINEEMKAFSEELERVLQIPPP